MILANDEIRTSSITRKIELNKNFKNFILFCRSEIFYFDLMLHFDQSMKLNFGEFGEFINGLRALNNSSFTQFVT